MANIKSAMKRAQIAEVRTLRNKIVKTSIKTSLKKFEAAIESKDTDTALAAFKSAVKKLDTAVTKGVIHKNSAARKKSTLARKFNAM